MNIVYSIPEKSWLRLSSPTAEKPILKKELIYEGSFSKDEQTFDISEELIDYWVASFNQMKAAGIDVPVPIGHTTDPELRRGTVVGMEKGVNAEGLASLYGYIEFNDMEVANQLQNSQVSIYVPEERPANGVERPLKHVITHVAITDYPVVNNLEEFDAIAASFACKPKKKGDFMIKKLATELGIELAEDTTDEVAFAKLLSHYNTMTASLEEMKKPKEPPEEDPPAGPPKPPEGGPPKEDDEEEKKKEMAASFGKKFAKTEKSSRKLRIEGLVRDGRVTKAVADEMEKEFCSDDLALAFSTDGSFNDGFEKTFEILQKNDKVLSYDERTGPQVDKDLDNPLVRDAKARNEG